MAYKFQSGDATLSGSVTLVNYQDLLFESDGVSDIGTAAKEARVVYTTRQTASVGISGSAVYANNFYGNGSGLTGVPGSTTSKVTGSNQNVDLQLVLVQNAGTTETLAVDNAGAIAFNPSTNLLSSTGKIGAGTDLSASAVVGGKSVLLGQNGFIGAVGDTDLLELVTNKLTVNGVISGSGALQGASLAVAGLVSGGSANFTTVCTAGDLNDGAGGSLSGGVLTGSAITIDTTIMAAANKFQVADDGDVTAVGGSFSGALSGSSTLSIAGNVQLDGADDSVAFVAADNLYFRDAGTGQMRRESFSDVMEVAAGTVTTTGIENSSGVLSFALSSLTEAAVASTDYVVFADANDSDNIKKEAVDDLMKIGMSLLDESTVTLANDFLYFGDNADSNFGKRIKAASFIAKMADGTSITSSNGVLSVVGAQNIDIDTIGNASRQLTSAGMNYASASITTDVTYTLPASPSTGDIVYIKLAAVTSGKHAVISGSGMQLIDGVSTLTASSAYAGISLCYVASDVWRVF
jgi:hypothetical protein